MTYAPFTARIDVDLKNRLQALAQREQRSTSQMANIAIDEFVRRKEAERRIIDAGLQLIETGEAISAEAVNQWLLDGDVNTDFPEAEVIPQNK